MWKHKKLNKWQRLAIQKSVQLFLQKEAASQDYGQSVSLMKLFDQFEWNNAFRDVFVDHFISYLRNNNVTSIDSNNLVNYVRSFLANNANVLNIIEDYKNRTGDSSLDPVVPLVNSFNYLSQISATWNSIDENRRNRFYEIFMNELNKKLQPTPQTTQQQAPQQSFGTRRAYGGRYDFIKSKLIELIEQRQRALSAPVERSQEEQTQSQRQDIKSAFPSDFESAVADLSQHVPWLGGLLIPAVSAIAESASSAGSELMKQLEGFDIGRYLTPELRFPGESKRNK